MRSKNVCSGVSGEIESSITGLILAGGQATRMHNKDKGLQRLNGLPLVQHLQNRLAPQCTSVMISANRNLEKYHAFATQVFPDLRKGFFGPLAGIEAGLTHCKTEWLMVVPCDTPYLPLDVVVRLSNAIILFKNKAMAAFAKTQEQSHPSICLLHHTLLASLSNFLDQGQGKLMLWLLSIHAQAVLFEEEQAFFNFNTAQMLDKENV